MELERKISILSDLGKVFIELSKNEYFEDEFVEKNEKEKARYDSIHIAGVKNGWFTKDSIQDVFKAWAISLSEKKIKEWLNAYSFNKKDGQKKLGLILAGNIPLVGLHDILCGLICDYHLFVKPSSKDLDLINLVIKELITIAPEWKERIKITDKLNDIDVLVATGSNNSARYFEYYFRDTKKIIRKNRTSIAIINKETTADELSGLGKDIFTHFGLGCRNVTKIYLPSGFDLDRFFNAIFDHKDIINHNKYANNYDYNKAVYLMNKIELIENGFLLLKEDNALQSPVGVVFYEYYETQEEIESLISNKTEEIQAVVSNMRLSNAIPFGKAQEPELWDYADGVDTIDFLLSAKG